MSSRDRKERQSGSEQLHFLNVYTASAGIAPSQMELHIRRAHRLRAVAVGNALAAVWRGIGAAVRRAVAQVQRRRDVRATERALRALSPRLLRDIGIEGHQIPAIARGLSHDTGGEPKATEAAVETAPALHARLDRAA